MKPGTTHATVPPADRSEAASASTRGRIPRTYADSRTKNGTRSTTTSAVRRGSAYVRVAPPAPGLVPGVLALLGLSGTREDHRLAKGRWVMRLEIAAD